MDDVNKNHKLNMLKQKGIYQDLSKDLLNYASKNDVSYFHHNFGVTYFDFIGNKDLSENFDISSTT